MNGSTRPMRSSVFLFIPFAVLVVAGQACRTVFSSRPDGPLPVATRGKVRNEAVAPAAPRPPLGPAPAGMSWEIRDVWEKATPRGDGKWVGFATVDTSGYLDTADDGAGRISASGEGVNERERHPNAFDNSEAKWCIKTKTIWIQYEYPGGARKAVTAYSITSANDFPGRDPRNWQLLGSNDGEAWEVVDERSNETFRMRHQKKLFEVKKPAAYAMYKLDVTENHGDDTSQLEEIELLVAKPAGE